MKSCTRILLALLLSLAASSPANAGPFKGGVPTASGSGSGGGSGGSGSSSGGASLPALSGGNTYVDVRGTSRMIQGYSGPLYKMSCTTCTPTTLVISQDVNGRGDESGVAAWNGGAYTTYDGHYSQVTGNYVTAETAAKKMLWNGRKENGVPVMVGGWNATAADYYQGYAGETISVNRNNFSIFGVLRSMGAISPIRYMSINATIEPAGGNTFGHTYKSINNQDSTFFPIVNQLAVYGYVSKPGANVFLHLNQQVSSAKPSLSSSPATLAHLGQDTGIQTFGNSDYAGIVVTSAAPTDTETANIKAALYEAFNVSTDRTNIMIGTPHSLTICGNPGVFNDSIWHQVTPYLSKPLVTGVVGINGQQMVSQLGKMSELTARYEAGASHVIYYLASAVNDIQGLSSMGGNAATITANATTIFNTYMNVKTQLKAQGATVSVIVATGWPVPNFWLTSAQDKLDKAQVFVEWNQMVRDNAVAQGYLVSDEATIDLTNALGDAVHTNRLGEGRRAAKLGPVVESILQ